MGNGLVCMVFFWMRWVSSEWVPSIINCSRQPCEIHSKFNLITSHFHILILYSPSLFSLPISSMNVLVRPSSIASNQKNKKMSAQPLPPKTRTKKHKKKPQEDPEYAYLAHIPLEVPSPHAKTPAVVAFIATFLIQEYGFPPGTAMRKASRLKSTDGAQLHSMDPDDFYRVFDLQGHGIWRMVRSSGYRRSLSSFLFPLPPESSTSRMRKEKVSEPESHLLRSQSESCAVSTSASSSAVATGSLRARRWSQRHASTRPSLYPFRSPVAGAQNESATKQNLEFSWH